MANISKNVSRRGFVAAAGATVAGLGLAGCAGNSDSTTDTTTGSADSTELITTDKDGFVVRAEQTDGKAPANECIIALEGAIQDTNPMTCSDGNSVNVMYYIYDTLVCWDSNFELQPAAADSWEISEDACTYTFHIRDGITFEDGTPFDAACVVTNYQAAIDPANNWRRRRMFIRTLDDDTEEVRVDNVYAVDEMTVAFHLVKPYSPFMNSVSQFSIVNPTVVVQGNNYDYSKGSAGSGPYRLVEYAQGDHTSLELREGYWGEEPAIEKITFREVPEAGSRIAMLQTGEATVVYPTPSDQVETIRSAGDINMCSTPSNIMRYVTLNNDVEALSDVRVRQAMNYAIDKDAYIRVMFSGAATEATSVLPTIVPGYAKQEPYKFDLEKAKSLMEEAGYADGFDINLIGDNSTQETKGMTFVMQQLAQININVNVQPNEPATNAEITAEPEDTTTVQMWYVNWSQSDADGFLRSLLYSTSLPPIGYNTAFWKNADFDEQVDAGNAAAAVDEQNEHYAEAQSIAWEACPWLFLASDNYLYSYKSYLSDVKMIPNGIDVMHSTLNV